MPGPVSKTMHMGHITEQSVATEEHCGACGNPSGAVKHTMMLTNWSSATMLTCYLLDSLIYYSSKTIIYLITINLGLLTISRRLIDDKLAVLKVQDLTTKLKTPLIQHQLCSHPRAHAYELASIFR